MHGRALKQYILRPVGYVFNAMRFDENYFTCQSEKEDKKAFKFRTFMGRFPMTSWQ